MFSAMKYFAATSYNYLFDNNKQLREEEIQNAIQQVENTRPQESSIVEPEPVGSEGEECFYANGVITTISENCVFIDNIYYCDNANVMPNNLTIGSKVRYLAYRVNEDQEIRVSKIVGVQDEWFANPLNNPGEGSDDENFNVADVEKQRMLKKNLVGKVEKREKRLVYAGEHCINLDNVHSEIVPIVGDWLKIECLMAVDPESPNIDKDILEVKKIEPLRAKLITGKITNYDSRMQTGSVDRYITFHQNVVKSGYVPVAGDTVVCDSIESDQGNFKWRAINVIPLNKVKLEKPKEDAGVNYHGVQLPPNMAELEKNKNGIQVDNDLKIEIDFCEETTLKVKVANSNHWDQVIERCSFATSKDKSQLTLEKPHAEDVIILNARDVVTYHFRCKAKFVGRSVEVIQFHFKKFQIARTIVIDVKARLVENRIEARNLIQFNRNMMFTQSEEDPDSYIRGVKPFKSAPFAVSNGVFHIPANYWKIVLQITNDRFKQKEAEEELANEFPSLCDQLTFRNYKRKFAQLLYLEEIAQKLMMQMYNMESVIFKRVGEFLALEVPGLAEKRPSLIVGDRIITEFKFSDGKDKKKYEGFIHQLQNSLVLVKFNQQFHDTYRNEDCKVSFKASSNVITRCHRAINAAVDNLGESFLFPTKVVEKEPQYILEEKVVSETSQNGDVGESSGANGLQNGEDNASKPTKFDIKALLMTRKLEWFNTSLNKYQKEAIKNILMGTARPLPYVIFGPPGTGKTITLCEAILQILILVPDSRILVASPSNSSANLISERLLDYNVLKPGDLVRLVANYYIYNEAISERLKPFCVTGDLSAGKSQDMTEGKRSYNATILGRHRITVGTCSALGILHNMNFKPGHFTHVLVDEAGQATEPEIMIPLSYINSKFGQVILAGDPLQLGPVVMSKYAGSFGLEQSFLVRLLQRFPYQRDQEGFEHGYDPRLVTKLLVNYRSLPEILELPNKLFYNSELIPFVSPIHSKEAKILKQLKDILPPREGSPPAVIFHGVNGTNVQDEDSPSWYNIEEAVQVFQYFGELMEKQFTADDIGIITPYKKQATKIRYLLAGTDFDIPKIGTVEEFQGQERNIIILSTVRSVSDLVENDLKFTLGFVSAPERLNVAITRARALLIIIGNPYLLSKDSYWRSVLDYCNIIQGYTGCNLQCDLNSLPAEVPYTNDLFT